MEYPEWINKNLREFLASSLLDSEKLVGWSALTEDKVKHLYALKIKALNDCICSPKLEKIWRRAGRDYGAKGEGVHVEYHDGQVWLTCAIFGAVPPDKEAGQYSAGTAEEKWKKEVIAALDTLLSLMSKTPHRYRSLYEEYIEKSLFPLSDKSWAVSSLQEKLPDVDVLGMFNYFLGETGVSSMAISLSRFREILLNYVSSISGEEDTYCDHFWTKGRRGGDEGRRKYFVRSLAHSFIIRTGGATVAEIVAFTEALSCFRTIDPKSVTEQIEEIQSDPKKYADSARGGFEMIVQSSLASP